MKPNSKGKQKEGKVPAFLPPEVAKFAKQLGLDITGLEPEAQQVWNHLEKLSTENPLEYERFVASQMTAAKEEKEGGNTPSGRSFRPSSEFVIEIKTFDGDGTIIREVDQSNLNQGGKPLYVNICSSDLIEPPKEKSGKVVDSIRSVADGLEIPLLIGPVRPFQDNFNAIDVVFHPIIPKICREERYFRGQVLDLAQDWILQETSVKFKKNSYTDIEHVKYKGGLGDSKDIPVLFMIDDVMLQDNGNPPPKATTSSTTTTTPPPTSSSSTTKKPPSKSEDVLSSTKSLLKEMSKGKEDSVIEELKTLSTSHVKPTSSEKAMKKSGPIIEEVDINKKNNNSSKISEHSSISPNNKVHHSTKSTEGSSTSKYKAPSQMEKNTFQDLLDEFENPNAYNPLDSNPVGDPEAMLIKDLANILAPETTPLPIPLPEKERYSTATSDSRKDPASTSLALPPPPPTSQQKEAAAVLTHYNSHPHLARVCHTINETNNAIIIEIRGIKSTAKMDSLVLESSDHEIMIQTQANIFESCDEEAPTSLQTMNIRYQLPKNQKILKNTVKAAWKRKVQILYITVPYSTMK